MRELLEDLIKILDKHKAKVFVEQEEDDSFLYLKLIKDGKDVIIDSGYSDLEISSGYLAGTLNKY